VKQTKRRYEIKSDDEKVTKKRCKRDECRMMKKADEVDSTDVRN
jgi:hypothetical protein